MKQFTFTENARGYNYPSAALASHIFSLTSSAVTASGVTVTIPRPTIKVKYNTNNSGRNSIDDFINVKPTVNGVSGSNVGFEASSNALAYNTDITMSVNSYSSSVVWSFNTSSLFNANNKSVKTIAINWVITNTAVGVTTGKYNPPGTDVIGYRKDSSSVTISGEGSITLNAPPTFDLVDSSDNPTTQVWFDTPYVYTGLTTASIKVKNLLAQYGGDISSVAFTIGNQTVSSTSASAQTLSIPLNAGGTFTPTVKVTDSRGQVTTKNLNAITVNTYVTPSVLFSVERTDSSGVANDEGESAVVTAKFDWTEAITTIAEPTIVVKDPNNLTVSVTKAWYKDRALTTPITDWSEITEDMQVYCLLDNANHNAFNTQYSYQIAITPIDGLDGSGTTITQTLGGAFYTVDFLAGGHGIAFGQPSTEEGFFCNMDATFKEDLVAQDMTAQEVQDFVDNLEGGGGIDFTRIKRELLWTNATSPFVSQTVSLALSEYDYVEVWFGSLITVDAMLPNPLLIPLGERREIVVLHALGDGGANENTGMRGVTVSATGVTFGDYNYKNRRTGGGLTTANQFAVPNKIYGIKYY